MKALIDMDLIVYRVGAACDNWHYIYKGERYDTHKDVKRQIQRECSDATEREEKLKTAVRERDPEPWEDVRESVISFAGDLTDPFDEYQGFISGKGNFRYKAATILPYKGTRSSATRPYHYDAIRQLLVDVFEAKLSIGMEADDCLGLAQTEDTIICTVDKDLDMVPGNHWNWEKDERYVVEPLEGIKNFYKQMLTGDSTDNILGLHGVGPKSKLLKNIDDMEDEEEMYEYVHDQYYTRFGTYANMFLVETSKLLWILQSDRRNPFCSDEYWE